MVSTTETTLPIPDREKQIELYYLQKVEKGSLPEHPIGFLHNVRSKARLFADPSIATGIEANDYYTELPNFLVSFREWAANKSFDLIAGVPSRRRDAEPYVAAIRTALMNAQDLTPHIHKLPGAPNAGEIKELFEIFPFFCTTYGGSLCDYSDLLIVDDIFHRGLSASALVLRLEKIGLPQNAKVSIASPLWIQADENNL